MYMRYTKTGMFKKHDAQSVIKRHLSDTDKFNFTIR
jgi:hypothetical protein